MHLATWITFDGRRHMFDLFHKTKNNDRSESTPSYEQAVILEIDLESGEELGSDSEHSLVLQLEDQIAATLSKNETVDGHDFGDYQAIVYVYGPLADPLFEKIRDMLRQSEFSRFEVTLQYGPPDDPDTKDKKFTLSW